MKTALLVPLGVLAIAGLAYIVLTEDRSDPSEAVVSQAEDDQPVPPGPDADLEPLDAELPRSTAPAHPESVSDVAPAEAAGPEESSAVPPVDEAYPGTRRASAARDRSALIESYHRRIREIGSEMHGRGEYTRYAGQPGEELQVPSSESGDGRPTVTHGKSGALPDGRLYSDIVEIQIDDHPDLVSMYDELKALGGM